MPAANARIEIVPRMVNDLAEARPVPAMVNHRWNQLVSAPAGDGPGVSKRRVASS